MGDGDSAHRKCSVNADLELILRNAQTPESFNMDKEGFLLKPDQTKGEVAVLNPTLYQDGLTWPLPFLYRVIGEDGRSEIKFRKLQTPVRVSRESWSLITPTEPYETQGCEDPRVTKIGDWFYVTYTAYDGTNARVALARTRDFRRIEKLGIISPQITVEKASQLVDDARYIEAWKQYAEDMLLPDKDASLHYTGGKFVLIHRLEPDMHIAFADSLEEFKREDYWKAYLQNLSRRVYIRAAEREKVGLGSPPTEIKGKNIGLYHIVDPCLNYYGSFFETDENLRIRSVLRNPLLKPESEIYLLREPDREKRVVFPTAVVADPKNKDNIIVYYGVGDRMICWRTMSVTWLFNELNHEENRKDI